MSDPEKPKRWTAVDREVVVLAILRREMTIIGAAERYDLPIEEIAAWQDRYLAAGQNALRSRPLDEETLKDREIAELRRRLAEATWSEEREEAVFEWLTLAYDNQLKAIAKENAKLKAKPKSEPKPEPASEPKRRRTKKA
jgi:hypothetical protein